MKKPFKNSKMADRLSGKTAQYAGGTSSILSALYHKILAELGIGMDRWGVLMERYLSDPKNCIPQNQRDKSSARGNLNKELLQDKMSWRKLCTGLRFLNVLSFEITLTLKHANGVKTVHSQIVKFDSTDESDE